MPDSTYCPDYKSALSSTIGCGCITALFGIFLHTNIKISQDLGTLFDDGSANDVIDISVDVTDISVSCFILY